VYGFVVAISKTSEAMCSQVARLLKEERAKSGFSLNLVAQKAGLSRQTVSFIEQELRIPTLDTLLRITMAMEIDLEKIISKARKLAKNK
jgi:transcriptional regulator with XRE-family HTH domain